MINTEVFKINPEYSRYRIYDSGKIQNINTGKFLKPAVINKGYYSLELWNDFKNKGITTKLHRIIAETFLGKVNGLVIDHIDNDKSNNSASNLQYVTNRYNVVKQRLYSGKFIREQHNKNCTCYVCEIRTDSVKRVRFTAITKKECLQFYCDTVKNIDKSVIELIKNFYSKDNIEIV